MNGKDLLGRTRMENYMRKEEVSGQLAVGNYSMEYQLGNLLLVLFKFLLQMKKMMLNPKASGLVFVPKHLQITKRRLRKRSFTFQLRLRKINLRVSNMLSRQKLSEQ
jgi:hypothetical protein